MQAGYDVCNTGAVTERLPAMYKVQGVLSPPGRAFDYQEHFLVSHHTNLVPFSSYYYYSFFAPPHQQLIFWGIDEEERRLTRSTLELLAEEDELGLVVDGEHTSTGDTTENVGTSSLEERLDTLSGDDLAGSIHGTLVLDGLTGGHHHATTDGVERVRGDTGTSGDGPSESERGQEVTLEVSGKEDRLDRVVHTEVQTTVDDDTTNGGEETTVETGNTVGSEGLLVDVYETVELALTTLLGGLGVVGKTGTGVVEGVDEEEGSGTSGTSGGQVTGHPLGVTVTLLLVGEHRLVGITEGEVQGLGGEVTDNVGSVTTPEGEDTLVLGGTAEALNDTVVLAVETAGLKHLILVLDEELDTLDGGGSGLRDGGGDTTHQEVDHEAGHPPNRLITLVGSHFDDV
jgi:hypothetical protein